MKSILISLAFLLLLALPAPVCAQGSNPPPAVDPNSMWGQVVDQNGNIRYSNLTDLGVIHPSASWMPGIPGIGSLQATYHEYQAPDGDIVAMPSATTLFFMALNPQASGLAQANTLQLGTGTEIESGAQVLESMVEGTVLPTSDLETAIQNVTGHYVSPNDFFTDVINGHPDWLWSVLANKTANFLGDLANQSATEGSLYTTLLLYTQDQCSVIPGGCPASASQPGEPTSTPVPPSCIPPVIMPGAITVTASKIAPPYSLVVGQDPAMRGADLTWEVTVEPTSYLYGVSVPIMGDVCVTWDGQEGSSNCTTSKGEPGILQQQVVGTSCQQHTQLFPEGLNWVTAEAFLSQTSRDWILNTLSLLYPEDYLHHPDFSFDGDPNTGSFQGDTFVWTFTQNRIQVADPGYFDLIVAGATSGTPVSSWRGFSKTGGTFPVYLEEAVIIQ